MGLEEIEPLPRLELPPGQGIELGCGAGLAVVQAGRLHREGDIEAQKTVGRQRERVRRHGRASGRRSR